VPRVQASEFASLSSECETDKKALNKKLSETAQALEAERAIVTQLVRQLQAAIHDC
jgi:hypothetical protein